MFSSHLDSLLSQEDVTLDDILADPGVVDECKAENKSLLSFITQPHCLRQLVEYSVSGPNESAPIEDQFRQCHVASELLSSGGPRMSYALLRDTESLNILYKHLRDNELTHLSASFLCRIISSLMQYGGEVQAFFAQKTDLSECILTSIDKPSILDLFYSFIQSPTNPEISLQLSDSTLISDLVSLLSVEQPNETHSAVIQCLYGLLASSRASLCHLSDSCINRRNRLQEKLESPETIQSIASRIFGQSSGQIVSDSLVINGLLYLRCLIDTSARVESCPELAPLPRNDHFYLWSDRVGTSLCEILQPNLGALKQRLLVCNDPSLNTSATPRSTYLSSARLHIARFLPYLITAKSDALVREVLNLDLINIVMDLFFLYPCNSFLHSTCECLVRLIVFRALLNIACSQSSPDRSPSNTVSFNSTDAFHQQFFTSNECSPKSDVNDASSLGAEEQNDGQSAEGATTAVTPNQNINLFWLFLNRLFVEGDLLNRISNTWNSAPSLPNVGHLRLISNLLTAVIGPCPEAYEDDVMGSSDHQIHLITPDHLLTVATNGCTNECDSNPPLRSYLRSNISDETWTSWCEFVRGPLTQANEKSYVNYAEFPNSVASSEQNVTEYKLTDLAISKALQNAYSTYCSQPLTTAFTDRFGFAEDEFAEIQSHPNLVLDSRLSEVSFSLHIHEDTENGSLFEQACNDVIQLNEKEMGLDGIRLPEPETSSNKLPDEPNVVTSSAMDDSSLERSSENSKSALPSRSKLIEVFNEIQSGLNNAFLDDKHDPYIDEDANSDDDLDAILVSSPRRLIPDCDCQTTHSALEDSGTPDPHMILNRFNHTAGLKNLPTLSETELDEEGAAVDSDGDSDEDEATDSLTDRRNGFMHAYPITRQRKPANGIVTHLPNQPPFSVSRKNRIASNGQETNKNRRPTPPVNSSVYFYAPTDPNNRRLSDKTVNNDDNNGDSGAAGDDRVTEHLTMKTNTQRQQEELHGNVFSLVNGVSTVCTNGDWVEVHRSGNQSSDPGNGGLTLPNGNDLHPSPPAVPLSTWKTHMFLAQQSDSVSSSSPHLSLSPQTGLTCDPENHPDGLDPIELGDLSAGLSHLSRATTTNTGVLQSHLNRSADRLGGAPRSLIMPTKRSTVSRPHHDPAPIPLGLVNVGLEHPDRLARPSSRLGSLSATLPSSPIPTISSASADAVGKSHSTDYSRVSSHFASKTPHMSCGITATVKVRHGSRAHNLPPFVISESELIPSDLGSGYDDASLSNTSTPADSLNVHDSFGALPTDLSEMEISPDPNSSKGRFRSHRTINLRPGSEGPVGQLNS